MLSGTAYSMPGWVNAGDLNARHMHLGDTGFEWLSRDQAVIDAFVADPLTFPAKPAQAFGIMEGLRLYQVPSKRIPPELPLLIAGGSDDSMASPRSVRRLGEAYRRRGLADVTIRIYPGARHEIFNEINKGKVLDDLVAWLDAKLVPSGA